MAVTNDLQHIRPAKPDAQLRVIYQGGSIAALASASLLASAGHQVIIFEKDSDALELQSVTSNERDRVSSSSDVLLRSLSRHAQTKHMQSGARKECRWDGSSGRRTTVQAASHHVAPRTGRFRENHAWFQRGSFGCWSCEYQLSDGHVWGTSKRDLFSLGRPRLHKYWMWSAYANFVHGVPCASISSCLQHNFNGYYPDCWRPGIECANGISATRELYETVVRNMVLRKDPKNITMLIGHAVEDFAWNETGAAITGQYCWSAPTLSGAVNLQQTSVTYGCQQE